MASTPGPLPTSHPNRLFWSDRFVDPKQQHRFAVNFPVYMPSPWGAREDYTDTLQLAEKVLGSDSSFGEEYADAAATMFPSLSEDQQNQLMLAEGFDQADIILTGFLATKFPKPSVREKEVNKVTIDGVTRAAPDYSNSAATLSSNKFSGGPASIVYRISEYVGFSFAPPAFGFKPGIAGYKDGTGQELIDPSKNSFTIGDATITLVTTLRDDLHFSLNLLYSLTALASANSSMVGSSTGGHQVFLYHPAIFKDAPENKVLVIKEYAPRPMTADTTAELPLATTPIVGLHKLYDPVIKGVQYTEYTYGGTEILKATITLGWGPNTGMSGFYSYQPTILDADSAEARLNKENNGYTRWTGDLKKDPVDLLRTEFQQKQKTKTEASTARRKDRSEAMMDAIIDRFTPPSEPGDPPVPAGHLVTATAAAPITDPAQATSEDPASTAVPAATPGITQAPEEFVATFDDEEN